MSSGQVRNQGMTGHPHSVCLQDSLKGRSSIILGYSIRFSELQIMSKIEISPEIAPFPKPIALVGSMVDGRPNFITVAWFNRLNRSPNIWGVAISKKKYTLEGIKQHGSFSVNLPSTDLVEKTDYCGLYSGRNVDKSLLFNIFYGKLETVPMIRECPFCVECSVYDLIELPASILVLGEVQHAYAEERCMTDDDLDPKKIDPFVFTKPGDKYWALGEAIGDAWSAGKHLAE
jgi:flavin reductase (DIM6/NTAB) family NADH-FMN oxidoreductase RutF